MVLNRSFVNRVSAASSAHGRRPETADANKGQKSKDAQQVHWRQHSTGEPWIHFPLMTPVLAALVTGLALYVSRGVLDQISTASGPMRVALLPSPFALGGFLAVGALGLFLLDHRTLPRNTATAVHPRISFLVLPLLGLAILLIPYLPWLADLVPALQMIAGPARSLIWVAILAQVVWVLWQTRLLRADWLQRWTVRRSALAIAVLTAVISGVAASRLSGTVLFPAGDEPHYLVIAQSLWRDRDFKIENNHLRGDYREYFGLDLAPHYLTRGVDNEIYSIHPVGMPILIAPVLATGGYPAVVVMFILMAALASALMWHAVVRATSAVGAATFAWAAVTATTPFLFNSFAVYPEIPAALAAIIALTVTFGDGLREPLARWLVVGLSCAALPWLSTKYAPLSAALVAIAAIRILWPSSSSSPPPAARAAHRWRPYGPGSANALVTLLVPYAASLIGWFTFFYVIWGKPWPQAPYGAMVQTSPWNLVFGAPGLLFDQEYGLLPYAPVYVLAFTGLWSMWREGGELRRRGIETAVACAALLATVGAFRIWWGGSASPGRPLTSGLLLMALPIAVAFRSAPVGSARRAAQHLLLWLSVGIAALALIAQQGFLISNNRDGTSTLLEYLSPRWPAWTLVPSFIYHEAPTALLHSVAWLVIAGIAVIVLSRPRTIRPGAASLLAIGTCFGALVAAAIVIPLLPASPAWPGIDLRARHRLPLLDAFDTVVRPVGVEFSPVRIVSAGDVATHASLRVEPGWRADPQPVRVLHNGRFSVPAGRYRAVIEWSGSRDGESLALQIGRIGAPVRSWRVEPRPGERWTTEFDLPMDASFVGFRGSPELERQIKRIAIIPLAVVDWSRRPKLPTVLGAAQFATASVFYHDDHAFPEPNGFWVQGGRSALVTFQRDDTAAPLTLRVHSGLIDNQLQIRTTGWQTTIALARERQEVVAIPSGDRKVVTIEFTTDRAFVPKEVNPTSTDMRPLGAWIEVVKP